MSAATVSVDPEIGEKVILRRYMDLPKLLDFLHSRALYLRRADGFADRLEGALFPSHRGFLDRAHAAGMRQNADHFYQRGRGGSYVSCWTRGAHDSMALWQLYGGTRTSVAITTTVGRLVRVARTWNRNVIIHRVKYVDHSEVNEYVIGQYTDMLQYKHRAYKYENEVRLIVPHQGENWKENPIDLRLSVAGLDELVRNVVVAPEATPEHVEVVRDLCAKYGLRSRVEQSRLAKVPV
jgi:hypothetical protein